MTIFGQLETWWHKRDLERRIRRYGWTAIYVGDYHSAPTWAYTVGLDESLNQPELIIFDTTLEIANALFWEAHDDLKSGALKIEDGLAWPPEWEQPGVWRKVHPEQVDEWLPLACMRQFDRTGRRGDLEAYQLVVADPQGNLPWQTGYDERLRERQPALYLPPAKAAAIPQECT